MLIHNNSKLNIQDIFATLRKPQMGTNT